MRFFVRLSEKQEADYHAFMYRFNVTSLRWTYFIACIFALGFILIDSYRSVAFEAVVLIRGSMIAMLLTTALWTHKTTPSPKMLASVTFLTSSIYILSAFAQDYFADMPGYFLPNYLILMFYVGNAALGLTRSQKIIQTSVIVLLYIWYSLSMFSESFHTTQIHNVVLNGFIAVFIGYLLERYKRLNFITRKEIINSKKYVEEVNDFKSKIISILSHDLNAPLSNLTGLLQLCDDEMISQEELDTHLQSVRKSLKNTALLLKNLIQWSKTQLEGFKPTVEKVNLTQTVDELIESLDSYTDSKGITVNNKLPEFHCFTDKVMITLALRNILTNAIKFSDPDSVIDITLQNENSVYALSITDRGIGMTEEELDTLFLPQKKSKSGTQHEGGSGIGLILVKEFIEKIGGSIRVESTPGKGSTFTILMNTNK
jgi:signal transduction histidine kinase